MFAGCEKWKKECDNCPLLSNYPSSILFDRSKKNFLQKKKSFLSLEDLTLVPVSKWLEEELRQSFFKTKKIHLIQNGIDTQRFAPIEQRKYILEKFKIAHHEKIILGVASNWYRKGLDDFIALRTMLPKNYSIVLVGLSDKETKLLPNNIIGIERTENVDELVALYSTSDVFFNPTWEDNFPTTNLEAMSCGTPVVTYNTGGSPEAITQETGIVVERGDLDAAAKSIIEMCKIGKDISSKCRNRIINVFDSISMLSKYIELYNSILPDKATT
jgi:glycosyltransferase involved in cell wall biosynthesis